MDLRRRLLLSDLLLLCVPPAATAVAAALVLGIASLAAGTRIQYADFEKAVRIRVELFSAAATVWGESPDTVARQEFGSFLETRLEGLRAEVYVVKDGAVVYATEGAGTMDGALPYPGAGEGPAISERRLSIGGVPYLLQTQRLAFEDGSTGAVAILIPTDARAGAAEAVAGSIPIAFVFASLATVLLHSVRMKRRIADPLVALNAAIAAISEGNLADEVVEGGDEEIRQVQRSLERLRRTLQENVRTRGRLDDNRKFLISSISHDLKTPLASIRGYVEGLIDGVADTPERRRKYLGTILAKTQGADRLIDDLVYYSRLELDQVPYDFEPTDPAAWLAAFVEENREGYARDGMALSFEDRRSERRPVLLDRERMKRVFQNLFENARKYRRGETGAVAVAVRDAGGRVLCEVRDEGAGIPKESLPYVFDRFYRADASRRQADGAGLGLAIAKQVVEDHRGEIWVRSAEGEGTTFVVALPAAPDGTEDGRA